MCWKIQRDAAASPARRAPASNRALRGHRIHAGLIASLLLLATVSPPVNAQTVRPATMPDETPGSGSLRILDVDGRPAAAFPLRHTEVHADIAGGIARVTVEQEFGNPYSRPIEAVYVFPLPHTAAIDDLEMHIGERIVRGEIRTRKEARQVYEQARSEGRVAALLDEERPNIFTQRVANILPGNLIRVRIRYADALDYQDDGYEMVIPTVVGPRFIPGTPLTGSGIAPAAMEPGGGVPSGGRDPGREPPGEGWAQDTDRVPDASHITPPVAPPGKRAGHDIGISVDLDAGVPLQEISCPSHAVDIQRPDRARATVRLRPSDTIPNKDFVLRYRVAGSKPELGYLVCREPSAPDGYGTVALLIQPQAEVSADATRPKELIFLLDCSGSMSGEPIARSKAAMRWALQHLGSDDTFQIIRFSDAASGFEPEPVRATAANIQRGLAYVDQLQGEGGTQMLSGILAALGTRQDKERLRIVCLMTDGYIGNESEILAAVRTSIGDARLFGFGIGSSVNRYLLDSLANEGRGAVDYVPLDGDTRPIVERFYDRIAKPTLTDLSLDWGGLEVQDLQPELLPDLFAGQTLVVTGRFRTSGQGDVIVRGRLGRGRFERRLHVVLPEEEARNAVLGTLWARRRIESLSRRMLPGRDPVLVQQATEVALAHHLMSPWTSFVAVDNQVVSSDGSPMLVPQPVEMPEGVSYEGVFGEAATPQSVGKMQMGALGLPPSMPAAALNSGVVVQGGQVHVRGGRSEAVRVDVPHANSSMSQTVKVTGKAKQIDVKSSDVATSSPDAAPAPSASPVVITFDPTSQVVALGKSFRLRITIHNRSSEALEIPAALAAEEISWRVGLQGAETKPVPSTVSKTTHTRRLAPGATHTYEIQLEARRIGLDKAGSYVLEIARFGNVVIPPGRHCLVEIR